MALHKSHQTVSHSTCCSDLLHHKVKSQTLLTNRTHSRNFTTNNTMLAANTASHWDGPTVGSGAWGYPWELVKSEWGKCIMTAHCTPPIALLPPAPLRPLELIPKASEHEPPLLGSPLLPCPASQPLLALCPTLNTLSVSIGEPWGLGKIWLPFSEILVE